MEKQDTKHHGKYDQLIKMIQTLNTMNNINQISIPKPCHQAWSNMAESPNGRYCGSCSKTVIDFSAMSDQQIIAHLTSASGKVCGRFDNQQFNMLNHQIHTDGMQASGYWKGVIIMLTMLTQFKHLKAQTALVATATEQGPANFILGKIVKADTIKYKTVTGCITDADDKSPLPGVTIKVPGMTIGTQTNTEGAFTLKVPETATELAVSYVGYKTQSIAIKADSGEKLFVGLQLNAAFMGEIVITRPPLVKRIYYRFIKRPIRKIFR